MSSEELEKSLLSEIESYLGGRLGEMQTEVSRLHSQISESFSSLLERAAQTEAAPSESAIAAAIAEHLRAAHESGVELAAAESAQAQAASDVALLKAAIEDIDNQRSQADILGALVNRAASFAPRVAFFVARHEQAQGWRARGLEGTVGDEAAKMYLMLGEHEMPHARFSVDARRGAPKTFRAKFRVESAGPVTVGVQFVNDFLDEKNADPTRRDRNLYFTNIEVTAPKPPPAESIAAKPTDHRSLLLDFATRAFRRPVAADEITPYAAVVQTQLARGANFEEAMRAGYKAILCSPDFLFIGLESGVPQPNNVRLGDHALASRLAFFLWDSMPDATLLELAAKNQLSEPATLRAQVERMLADARSERFIEHFLDEWLELKKIDFTTPDPNLYPEFDPWLRDSMLAESRAYFRKLLTQNLGVSHVVAAETMLINQRLAELYGIRGVTGAELREVAIPAGSARGGFLTQASVLKVTANGTATSPVLRGVWVMERLLGIPRQPPPPNIPAVEPDATGAVTIRQMIEKHRADTACASCHAKMDPPGMALESFDFLLT